MSSSHTCAAGSNSSLSRLCTKGLHSKCIADAPLPLSCLPPSSFGSWGVVSAMIDGQVLVVRCFLT